MVASTMDRAIRDSIKKVDVVTDGKHGDIEDKKKADAPSPSKKIRKEVNAAERTKKPSYNKAPPPAQQPGGAIRMYNLKSCFKNSDWGILITDWQQLPNEEKDKYRAAQVLSEDDGSDEELTGSVAERDEYNSTLHEVNHREAPGPNPAAAASSRVTSTVAGDVNVDAFVDELHTLSLEVGAAACVNQEKTKMIAAPAVALGSTHNCYYNQLRQSDKSK
ncbi:hypothetical protein CYMTET_8003 [Cymbomonas tetramitiformis]|uniref:Uncharacterized protein n=1 Tax=Cymbomonas tetramitiformis TaxID=36881 RepID=A0AAE0LGA7_9CHLO|nr:hypothetical protein CYMTET_8003 [Cymbomonas tetramitiformis]